MTDKPPQIRIGKLTLTDFRNYAALTARFDTGAVVLTGSGRAFCAGVDLEHLAAMNAGTESSEHTIAFNDAVRHLAKPLIVAVNGLAVGVGTTMCLHADLVIAGASARFRTPFSKIGLAPEIGSSQLLPDQIGHQRASWMLLTSDWVDAPTAAAWGLVLEMVDDDRLIDRAVALGEAIAGNDPEAVAAAKATMRAWRLPLIEAAEEVENAAFRALLDRGVRTAPEQRPR